MESSETPAAARVVADADVLAADLLVAGETRDALDHVRRHSWVDLLASEPLLDDAAAVVAALADDDLAADWRERIDAACRLVDHPEGDHPGLATAYRGEAAHLLTFDEGLSGARTNLSVKPYAALSIRSPDAFARLFDPEPLYESLFEDDYSGPDRDPRG